MKTKKELIELIDEIVLEVEDLISISETDYYGKCTMYDINNKSQYLLHLCFKLQEMTNLILSLKKLS